LPGTTLSSATAWNHSTNFGIGAFLELGLIIDLDRRKHWFLDIHARYDYISGFNVSNGATSSTINASSWGGGMGLGYRF